MTNIQLFSLTWKTIFNISLPLPRLTLTPAILYNLSSGLWIPGECFEFCPGPRREKEGESVSGTNMENLPRHETSFIIPAWQTQANTTIY